MGFDIYTVEVKRHDDLIAAMQSEYEIFWKHVVEKTEPEIDTSAATYRAACRVYQARPMNVKHLDDEGSSMIDLIRAFDDEVKANEKLRDQTRSELVSVAGSAEYLVTSDGQWYSFKSSRGRKRTLKPHNREMKV
jgi:hypothetical protein